MDAMKRRKVAQNSIELKPFPGLCSSFKEFASNSARIAMLLIDKINRDQSFNFKLIEEELETLKSLGIKLILPLVLALPYVERRLTPDTDAFEVQVGCVFLMQRPPYEMTNSTGYWSWSITSTERVYDTTKRECLVVVWVVQLLRPYVEYTQFILRTHYVSSKWILKLSRTSGSLGRCLLQLSKLDFDVPRRAGVKQHARHTLSRLRTGGKKRPF